MNAQEYTILFVVIGALIITLLYAYVLFHKVSRMKVQNEEIAKISSYIREGAMAFLKREYMVLIPFVLIMATLLCLLGFIPAFKDAEGIGWDAAIAFSVGAFFSGLAGFIGMRAATKANARTAEGAQTGGMSKALKVAFTGGSVLGLTVVSLGLLGLAGMFTLFYYMFGSIETAVQAISGYGMGASMIALFARVGGGIYTKAADVGADLVGKVEAGIPEDDPRNPAVIADNVGDNVGDVAGMGSDLCESYVGSIISALAIGIVAFAGNALESYFIVFPIMIAGVGVVASMLSVMFIRMRQWHQPQKALNMATWVAMFIVAVAAIVLSWIMLDKVTYGLAIVSGVLVGLVLGKIAEYYTSEDYHHVKEIAVQSETGHATNIIAGFGVGMQSTALTIATLLVGVIIAYAFADNYGIGLAAVGMLSVAGITISVDGYGPISDNAGGISQMANLGVETRKITDKLDSVGNTTAAIGKGFCIGSATLTSLALFVAYTGYAELGGGINIVQPAVIVGILVGAMLPYLFSSLTIKSVGKAANKMIEEVRRQFRANPNIMEGNDKPDYALCVDISTKAALKEMILPGVIALISPILVGILLGAEALGGLLVGGLASAIMLAVFMANSGGAWDNAKKYIEEGNLGGRGSETHRAAITGDTVGDPFKDTAGPAMDILIKLMSIISLILAPVLKEMTPLLDFIFKR